MTEDYIDCRSWLHPAGRSDHVDEIADQFERRSDAPTVAATHWPAHPTSWRIGRTLRPRDQDRLAG